MFHNLNLRFETPAAFAAWLCNLGPLDWAPIGSVYHNTFKPSETDWRGHASMAAMARHYTGLGWTTGPHLFLASGTAHDGLFVMTSPVMPGTHAGPCNARRFGIEVVGNFDSHPMSAAQITLLTETIAALHRWQGLGVDLLAHRDCMPGRTCPGDAAYAQKPIILAALSALLQAPNLAYTEHSPILALPPISAASAAAVVAPHFPETTDDPNAYTRYDIESIIDSFWRVCQPVGVNPLAALAQTIHETGEFTSFWSQRPQRNPAGIGVTGKSSQVKPPNTDGWKFNTQRNQWEVGVSFKDWHRHSIPAQIGRLLAYALKVGEETPEQRDLITKALTYRNLPASARGSAPTLRQLGKVHNLSGHGWAVPGAAYGVAIARKMNDLVRESL